MEIISDYSITKLFYKKEVIVTIDKKDSFVIKIPTFSDIIDNKNIGFFINLFSESLEDLQKTIPFEIESSLDFLKINIFYLNRFKEYISFSNRILESIKWLLPHVKINNKEKIIQLKILDKDDFIELDNEIWDFIIYILKTAYGLKTVRPPVFDSPAERKLYEAQLAAEEKINKIKKNSEKKADDEIILKMLLNIIYSFPSLTFGYLFNQTLAQINWLYSYAAKSVNYQIDANLFTAGNMKKGKTPEFFIK